MTNFHNVSLPKYVAIFAVGSSEFSTSTAVSMSGREVRSMDTEIPRRRYSLKNCCLSLGQFESFYSFFQARAGQRFSFRLRDHFDYKVEKHIIGVGDGATNEFQLYKTYDDNVSSYTRIITKPVTDSVGLWHIDQVLEIESVDDVTGKVRLSEAPAEGVEICASFIFDVPVRFATDSIKYSLGIDGSIMVEEVELIEVYE
jgi:uncharacterized protein (TIGR02217 family)